MVRSSGSMWVMPPESADYRLGVIDPVIRRLRRAELIGSCDDFGRRLSS
jgi:hypothetical protein